MVAEVAVDEIVSDDPVRADVEERLDRVELAADNEGPIVAEVDVCRDVAVETADREGPVTADVDE